MLPLRSPRRGAPSATSQDPCPQPSRRSLCPDSSGPGRDLGPHLSSRLLRGRSVRPPASVIRVPSLGTSRRPFRRLSLGQPGPPRPPRPPRQIQTRLSLGGVRHAEHAPSAQGEVWARPRGSRPPSGRPRPWEPDAGRPGGQVGPWPTRPRPDFRFSFLTFSFLTCFSASRPHAAHGGGCAAPAAWRCPPGSQCWRRGGGGSRAHVSLHGAGLAVTTSPAFVSRLSCVKFQKWGGGKGLLFSFHPRSCPHI